MTGAVPLCALDVWMWMTFRDRRSTLWALGGWTQQDSWQLQGIVRLRGVTEVTFRDRRSTLWALWTEQDSWQSQGIRDKRKTSRSQLGMPGGGLRHLRIAADAWWWSLRYLRIVVDQDSET